MNYLLSFNFEYLLMLKKFLNRISGVARSINGTPVQAESSSEKSASPGGEEQSEPISADEDSQPSANGRKSILDNAIDNRDQAVKMIVDSFRSATGSKSKEFERLTVLIPYKEPVFDPLCHAWADEQFVSDLRRELDNALLSAVGASKIELKFVHASELDPGQCREVIPEALYVAWKKPDLKPKKVADALKGTIALVPGTGTLVSPVYEIDPDRKTLYRIGRGEISRRSGSIRRNDIVISDSDPDPAMMEMNSRVSSNHADIVVRNGQICLRASAGGCRSMGGAATKLLRDDKVIELSDTSTLIPLADGDMIELGKSLTLIFTVEH